MKSFFSLLCFCLFISVSLCAQNTDTESLIADVELKEVDTIPVNTSAVSTNSKNIAPKQRVLPNKPVKKVKPISKKPNHRAKIDSLKRIASRY